jgi:hypothetical protein
VESDLLMGAGGRVSFRAVIHEEAHLHALIREL